MSDKERPAAAKHAADAAEDAPSALQAVQAALDRRDNGGAADRPAPADAAAGSAAADSAAAGSAAPDSAAAGRAAPDSADCRGGRDTGWMSYHRWHHAALRTH